VIDGIRTDEFEDATQPRFARASCQAPSGMPVRALAQPGGLVLAPLTGCRRVARHPHRPTRFPS